MEYSSDKVMSRKEYLKSKKKSGFAIRIIKYSLLLVVVVLLGVYLFKQLDVYNNVTKIANKVVEETALAKTMTMYYLSEGYSKDAKPNVVLYKASDESRTSIEGTENFYNIKLINGNLYGVAEGKLYVINLETKEKSELLNKDVKEYIIKGDKIYYYFEADKKEKTGIYVYDNTNRQDEQLINIVIYQMLLDDNYIYVVSKGKTEKSLVRYNLNGSGRTILSNKEIITHIQIVKGNIYFIANNQLYKVSKSGKDLTRIFDEELYIDSDIKKEYSAKSIFAVAEDVVYYISNSEEKELCRYDMKTGEKQSIVKKDIESIQLVDNILYYKLNNSLQIYKTNIETGKSEKVTSIRGKQYICIN